MPRPIDIEDDSSCEIGDCVEALTATGFDVRDEASLTHAAAWLRRLGNNRQFLGDLLIETLAGDRAEIGEASSYSPQAIVLSPPEAGCFLRANVWPAPQDYCFRASGAHNFVYGTPHDHNFDFLTVGYFGPGYRSDYFEYDYEAVAGWTGEPAHLRFVERSALSEGRLMHYRAHRDVHSQIPPESMSVSLNILASDFAQGWFDQYGFDPENGRVSGVLNCSSTEAFLRLAVGLGGAEAFDLAECFGRSHPSERLRLASFEARASIAASAQERDELWRNAELSGSRLLAMEAKARRRALAA